MDARALRQPPALFAACLVALAVPPVLVAAGGGGEFALGPLRLGFYDLSSSVLGLVGLLLWLGRRGGNGRAETLFAWLSLAALAYVCLLVWAPPADTPAWLAMKPGRPLILGWLLLLLAVLTRSKQGVPVTRSHLPGSLAMIVALLGGVGLHRALGALDRSALAERLAVVHVPGDVADTAEPAPDLLLIVVDTLRADALANASDVPLLASLATQSVVFDRAVAPAPWTVPSMMSLMTGLYPSSFDPVGRGIDWVGGSADARPLHSAVPRLASLLSDAGYSTAGFVKNPFLTAGLGFEQGFDVYERVHGDTAEDASAGQLVNAALRWAAAMTETSAGGRRAPWFLYLHFMDPHVNYRPPPMHLSREARNYSGDVDGRASTVHAMIRADSVSPLPAEVAQLKELYAGEVRYLDAQLARLFAALESRGLVDDRTCVVFTSDHGEQFGEHGSWLHGDIHGENVRVPLMIRAHDLAPSRRNDPANLVDLLPTLARVLGVPSLRLGDGRDLLAPAAAEFSAGVHTEFGGQSRLTGPRYSLLRRSDGRMSLYDSQADPTETNDLAKQHPEIVADMLASMEAHAARPPLSLPEEASEAIELDTETLEAIGYVGG
jgi:arylsulfatase A-like enzyme